MFKRKRFLIKVLKRSFALLACVMVIFASSFSSYAVPSSDLSFYLGGGSRFPVVPVSYSQYDTSSFNSVGSYSGTFDLYYYFNVRNPLPAYCLGGNIIITQPFSIVTYYTSVSGFNNQIVAAVSDFQAFDMRGDPISFYSPAALYTSYVPSLSGVENVSPFYNFSFALYPYGNDLSSTNYSYLKVTISINSTLPLMYVLTNRPTVTNTLSVSSSPPSSSSAMVTLDSINVGLNSLNSKTDTTNNKLQNLTNGYDNTAINNSNTSLNNSLTDYDTQEDEIISSATNFFEDIQTPISFFESGAFIAASSFVWQWLQGVYEHLGQAQVVVDVFLALTVAFSFVGLQKYIWRHSGRSSGGSAGKKGG